MKEIAVFTSFILSVLFPFFSSAAEINCRNSAVTIEDQLQVDFESEEVQINGARLVFIVSNDSFVLGSEDSVYVFPKQNTVVVSNGEELASVAYVSITFLETGVLLYWELNGEVISNNVELPCFDI